MTMTLERPGTLPVTGEWNHSCSAGTCGNCGNPGNILVPVSPDGTGERLTVTADGHR